MQLANAPILFVYSCAMGNCTISKLTNICFPIRFAREDRDIIPDMYEQRNDISKLTNKRPLSRFEKEPTMIQRDNCDESTANQ